MRRGRDGRGRGSGTPGAAAPLDLIHTTNSPNPTAMRVPGRLTLTFRDVNPQGMRELFRLVEGELSPVEFLVLRRAAHAAKFTQ